MGSSNISIAKRLLANSNVMHLLMQSCISLSIYYALVHRLTVYVCSEEQPILN